MQDVLTDLEQVNVICAKALQTVVDGAEDGSTRKATLIDIVLGLRHARVVSDTWLFTERGEALGEDDHLLARDVVLLESLADDGLGGAVGVNVCLEVSEDIFRKWSIVKASEECLISFETWALPLALCVQWMTYQCPKCLDHDHRQLSEGGVPVRCS